jgi:2-iminobutanoate/2-iminopropanoate deaminase
LAPGGVGPQTTQTLRNIEQILAAAGCTLADVVKMRVYLADLGDFDEMNRSYLAIMGDQPPARITVGGVDLALGAAVEIECVAFRGG